MEGRELGRAGSSVDQGQRDDGQAIRLMLRLLMRSYGTVQIVMDELSNEHETNVHDATTSQEEFLDLRR